MPGTTTFLYRGIIERLLSVFLFYTNLEVYTIIGTVSKSFPIVAFLSQIRRFLG